MSQRLPIVGSDDDTWGTVLNDFLSVSLYSDGTLNPNVVGSSQIQNNAVGTNQLATSSVTASQISAGAVGTTQLSNSVQTILTNAEQTTNKDQPSGYAGLDSNGLLKTAELPSSVVSGGQFVSAMSATFGAHGNGIKGTGGAMTSGQTDLTDSGANWSSADVGKTIMVKGAGGSTTQSSPFHLTTTIAIFVSSTHVELAAAAINTVTGALYHYGNPDDTPLASAVAACPVGGVLDLAGHIYITTTTWTHNVSSLRVQNGTIISTSPGTTGVLVSASSVIHENLTVIASTGYGTNYSVATSTLSACQVTQSLFQAWYCHYDGGYYTALALGGSQTNGTKIVSCKCSNSNLAQNSSCIYIAPSANGNFDIDIDNVLIEGDGWINTYSTGVPTSPYTNSSTTGVADGILAFDTARCTYRNCRVIGCTRMPTLTMTGWVQQGATTIWACRLATGTPGSTGKSTDRNDGNTAVIHMNGTEIPGSDYSIGTSPPANSWSQSGGYVYLNVSGTAASSVGPNNGSITILSDTVSGYGITNYNSTNGFQDMSHNLVEDNEIYGTDGFGIYWALSRPVSLTGGATTNGSQVVTMTSTTGCQTGQAISGINIPFGATILSVDSSTQIHLDSAHPATATGTSLTFTTGGAYGNTTRGNSLEYTCMQGTQDTSLPFAGIGWNGGQDSRMIGDTVRYTSTASSRAAPGIYFSDGANITTCTGTATGVTVEGATSDGFFVGTSNWTLTGCTANNNDVNGFNSTTAVTSVSWVNNQFIGCSASGNVTGSGLNLSAAATSSAVKIRVIGGEYTSNGLRGVNFATTTDSTIVGAHVHSNNVLAGGQPEINLSGSLRTTITGCNIHNGVTGILVSATANEIVIASNTISSCTSAGLSISAAASNVTVGENAWISNADAILLSTSAPNLAILTQIFVSNTSNIVNGSSLPYIISGSANTGTAIWSGSGAPAFTAATGDRFNRTDTPGTSDQREYICTSGSTPTWVGVL